ncbi:MAG TPA: hypothetical protein VFF73_30915, partial [Planctomycetota bacterium]|nr:hypothetical protein [Planctomycetota bacterium]
RATSARSAPSDLADTADEALHDPAASPAENVEKRDAAEAQRRRGRAEIGVLSLVGAVPPT